MADRIRSRDRGPRRVFGLSLEPEPERVYPQAGGGPNTTLAAQPARLRQPRGRRPVRRRAGSTRRRSPARREIVVADRDASGRADPGHAPASPRPACAGTDLRADHRRRPPARASSRSSSPPGSPTGRSASRPSSSTRTPARSTPRRATRRTTRNDYKAIAAERPVALHRPDRVERLRAGLGVQDDDRGGRAREGDGHDR